MTSYDTDLLHGFVITQVLECIADPTKNRVIAQFPDDVSPVFPYLNAVVPRLMYNPGANALSIKRGYRLLTIYPRGATLAKVDGRDDAEEQMRWFQQVCNEVWQRREEILPCYEKRKTVDPLDVYQLLPRLNCRECGQATCWTFSWELLFGDLPLDACPHLSCPAYAEAAERLRELIS
jgi:ArsR family metal-binding transcriptional regulator